MRAAQIKGGIVINYAEVLKFGGEFVDPMNSKVGDLWDGAIFNTPILSPEEAESARVAAIKNAIDQLERANPMTLRGQREMGLIVAELVKAVTGNYPTGPAYPRAKELETAIVSLRGQL